MQDETCPTAWLLASAPSVRAALGRAAVTLALAAAFGAALGARGGPASMLRHAAGAPLAVLVVLGLALPALAISLSLVDAPIALLGLGRATARASALAGLVLGGLAPALALFSIAGEDAESGATFAVASLVAAGLVAARAFRRELDGLLTVAGAPERRRSASLLVAVFVLFSAVLAARVWWLVLPALRGGAA